MSASTTMRTVAISRGPARGLLVAGGQVQTNTESLSSRVEKVARVAAVHAAAVDRESRLPQEAITVLREARLLGVAVPREFGGEGASVADVADICYALGRACSSTAMIYAMHQTKVACIARHGRGSAWHQLLLRRICGEQMLLASSTTEGDRGGDIRNSAAAVERHDARIMLERNATVISYGEAADGLSRRRGAQMTPPAPIRFWSCSSSRTIRCSGRSAGTRSACAARAARASSSRRRERASRCFRSLTPRSTPAP